MKRKGHKLLSKVAHTLDFPSDVYSGGMRIEIYSDNEAVVYGVLAIEDYSPQKTELLYKGGKIVFSGEKLMCNSYVEGVVCIEGKIRDISLEGRE